MTTDNGSEYNRKREMQLPSLHKRERTRGYRQLILRISHKYMYNSVLNDLFMYYCSLLFLEDTILQDKLTDVSLQSLTMNA